MPKRVLDFDALWASDKLARCAPWAQAEYAWLYGLADASGSFELTNLRVIWGRVAAIRHNLSLERLEQIFDEFREKGLLFAWEENGKRYGHWTGCDAPGRLPPPSWRARLERLAPPVPHDALAAYVCAFAHTPDSVRVRGAAPMDAARDAVLKDPLEAPQAQDGDRDLEGDGDQEGERKAGEGVAAPIGAPQEAASVAEGHRCQSEARHRKLLSGRGIPPEKRAEGFLPARPESSIASLGMTESSGAPVEARWAYHGVRLCITARQDALLGAAFPWVERQGEYRKMESWLEGNPLRRPRSASRFVHNWFAKIDAPSSSSRQSARPVPVEARVGRGPQGPVRVRREYLEEVRRRAASPTQPPARAAPATSAAQGRATLSFRASPSLPLRTSSASEESLPRDSSAPPSRASE
jgi:hypothetical protein